MLRRRRTSHLPTGGSTVPAWRRRGHPGEEQKDLSPVTCTGPDATQQWPDQARPPSLSTHRTTGASSAALALPHWLRRMSVRREIPRATSTTGSSPLAAPSSGGGDCAPHCV